MTDRKAPADFGGRVDEIREIAKGIYDHKERDALLRFVADCEKFAAALAAKPQATLT